MSYLARDARRSAVLDATVRLFQRDGLGAVTTRSVAAESQISPGLVHHLFGSTAELTALAWQTYLEREQSSYADIAAAGGPVALEAFFDNFLDPDRSEVLRIWADAWVFAQREPTFAPVFAAGLHDLTGILAAVLAPMVDQPEEAAIRLLLLAFGLAGAAVIDPERLGQRTATTMREALQRELAP